MSEPTNQDLKDMILSIEKLILNLDKKIEVGLAEVRVEITEVRGEIKRVEEKVDGVAKRLDNQEFISRGAIVTFLGTILAAVTKYIFFSDRLP